LKKACIVTLGCPKNEADSDAFATCLSAAGWMVTDSTGEADLLLLNTCAFIEPAVEESLEVMEQAAEWKSGGDGRLLVLAGCLPGRYEVDDSEGLEAFDLVIGPADTASLAAFLGPGSGVEMPMPAGRAFRYLKVSEGCSNGCAYCTIPLIRGPGRNRPPDEILGEASELARLGAAEIGIVGQDTGAWRHGVMGMRGLLEKLASGNPETWFRLYYVHPAHVVPGFAELVEEYRNIMPYIDIPVQHYADSILRRMGRGYTGGDLDELFAGLDRRNVPVAVRTTVIVGYPGETEEDFEALAGFLSAHECIRIIAAFPYWHEEGTPEYRRALPEEMVPPEIVRARLARIGEIADGHYTWWGGFLEGGELSVLVDAPRRGHSVFDAPEVDGACVFEVDVPVGGVLRCRVMDWEGPDLMVEPVE